MAVVVFDPVAFKARYPEFAAVSNTVLGAYFLESGLYLSNTDASPVQNVTRRALLLNMLTAHIGYIGGALSADGLPRPVGRISDAHEGTVQAQMDYAVPGSAAWFAQSQYGAAFWQATTALRGFRYSAQPTRY